MSARLNYRPTARRLWPDAYEIAGKGRWAVVSYCGRHLTVDLYATLETAEAVFERMKGCCGDRNCINRHRLIDLDKHQR